MTNDPIVASTPVKARTLGVSPKMWGAVAAVLTAVITYVLAEETLDLPPGVVVALQAVLIALSTAATIYGFGPGSVLPTGPADER